jgi:hypothetical protein
VGWVKAVPALFSSKGFKTIPLPRQRNSMAASNQLIKKENYDLGDY